MDDSTLQHIYNLSVTAASVVKDDGPDQAVLYIDDVADLINSRERTLKQEDAEFRKQCAKDFCVAILSNPRWSEYFNGHDEDAQFSSAYYKKNVVENAIAYADYLIERLK